MQFGIVTPFALHQPSPEPSADDSACAKLGKGLKHAKSADKLMGARSGNDSTSVSCESLRARSSQPCTCLDATSRGLDLGSSNQEQPEKVRQKASPEIAMKRQVYRTVLHTFGGYRGVCMSQSHMQPGASCRTGLLAVAPPYLSSGPRSFRPAVTDHLVDLPHPSPEHLNPPLPLQEGEGLLPPAAAPAACCNPSLTYL